MSLKSLNELNSSVSLRHVSWSVYVTRLYKRGYKADEHEWKTSPSAWWGLLHIFFLKTQRFVWLCTLQALLWPFLSLLSIFYSFLESNNQNDELGGEFYPFLKYNQNNQNKINLKYGKYLHA